MHCPLGSETVAWWAARCGIAMLAVPGKDVSASRSAAQPDEATLLRAAGVGSQEATARLLYYPAESRPQNNLYRAEQVSKR